MITSAMNAAISAELPINASECLRAAFCTTGWAITTTAVKMTTSMKNALVDSVMSSSTYRGDGEPESVGDQSDDDGDQ